MSGRAGRRPLGGWSVRHPTTCKDLLDKQLSSFSFFLFEMLDRLIKLFDSRWEGACRKIANLVWAYH